MSSGAVVVFGVQAAWRTNSSRRIGATKVRVADGNIMQLLMLARRIMRGDGPVAARSGNHDHDSWGGRKKTGMKSIEYYLKGLFRNIEQTDEVKEQIEELSSHITTG